MHNVNNKGSRSNVGLLRLKFEKKAKQSSREVRDVSTAISSHRIPTLRQKFERVPEKTKISVPPAWKEIPNIVVTDDGERENKKTSIRDIIKKPPSKRNFEGNPSRGNAKLNYNVKAIDPKRRKFGEPFTGAFIQDLGPQKSDFKEPKSNGIPISQLPECCRVKPPRSEASRRRERRERNKKDNEKCHLPKTGSSCHKIDSTNKLKVSSGVTVSSKIQSSTTGSARQLLTADELRRQYADRLSNDEKVNKRITYENDKKKSEPTRRPEEDLQDDNFLTADKHVQAKVKDTGYTNGTTNGTVDIAFRKISKHFTAFLIWRIENMTVVPLPKEQYGTFYDEDSYIVYAASLYGQPSGTQAVCRELKGGMEFHIHFWLGKYTTSDKAGVAAYKTVELDSYLGGKATQHREVQGCESPRFKSYFREGIRVLKGGTASGFKQVTDTFEPRLYQVKGKRAPVVTQMSDISWKHFNSGDVFLVHTKTILFVWVGRAANPVEKLHGTKAAMQLRTEHNTPNIVFVDDGYEKTMYSDDKKNFEKYLPLSDRFVAAADEVTSDENAEKKHRANIKLYQCSDSSGKYRVTEIKSGPLKQSDLNSDDVFILDHGLHGIWIWVGKKASQKERVEAMRNARGFVKKKKYLASTAVTRVVEGAEPLEFKMLFTEWVGKDETKGMGKAYIAHGVAKIKVTKFDAATMHDRPALAATAQLIDDGSGTVKVWRIRKFEAIELTKERYGTFFAGDCYLVTYNYKSLQGNRSIFYYWMGIHSVQEEQGVAAIKTVEFVQKQGGTGMEVRVTQGKEPAHFLQLFKGKMRIFNGKGTDFDATGKNMKTPHTYLLQVQGSTTYNTKAVQVSLKASALNSNYCYVLRKGNHYFIWCGNYSNGDNREMAKGFVGTDFALISEGNESAEFWNAIGGKTDYFNTQIMKGAGNEFPARLFQCSLASGQFKAEEILNFVQTDLAPEDVMLLDAHDTIFLWVGNLSTKDEQKISLQTAHEYMRTDPAGRDLKAAIVHVKQGNEPPIFTGFFPAWDDSLWKEHRSYEELRTEIETSMNQDIKRIVSTVPRETGEFDNYHKYSITVLKAPTERLPSTVDPLKKELHLTYDDFVSLFNMEYKEFEKLPLWKQQEMKKKNGLF